MSVNTPTETYQCAWCDGERHPQASVKGSFCSSECHELHRKQKKAEHILNQIRYDHRLCATCCRIHKEVEPPKPEWAFMGYRQAESQLAAVGFQYTNENAVESEVVVSIDDYGRPNNIKKGSGCVCGVTSHSDVITELRDRFRIEYTHYLCLAINLLQDEGKVETEMDRERLFNAAIRGENFEEALIGAL